METCKFFSFFDFAKYKVKPLAVIMDKPGLAVPVSVIHAAARKYCNYYASILMAFRAECPVINQLRLDFSKFTRNLLGSDFVRLLLTVHTQNSFFGREVICVSTGQPNWCKYVKR
jgi:hypothetical protein